MGAVGKVPPALNCLVQLSDHRIGVSFSWAAASLRPVPSLTPSDVSRMLKGLSASSGLVPGGPRSSTLAAPCFPMLAFSPPTPTFVRPLAASSAPLSPTTIGALRLLASPRAGSAPVSAREHAPAAYVGSFSACRNLCAAIWSAFDPFDLDEGCHLAAAEGALGASIPSGTSIDAESDALSQKSLSAKIEACLHASSGTCCPPPSVRWSLEASGGGVVPSPS